MQPPIHSNKLKQSLVMSDDKNDQALIASLNSRMSKADWWHSYSDDYKVRERGSEEIAQIHKDLSALSAINPDAARDLWKLHAPKEFARPMWENFRQPPTQESKDRQQKQAALEKAREIAARNRASIPKNRDHDRDRDR
jgi:hypothetical protein